MEALERLKRGSIELEVIFTHIYDLFHGDRGVFSLIIFLHIKWGLFGMQVNRNYVRTIVV
jgi:hypothetical protein